MILQGGLMVWYVEGFWSNPEKTLGGGQIDPPPPPELGLS